MKLILLATEKAVIQGIAPSDPECVKVEGGSGLFDVDKFVCSTRPYKKAYPLSQEKEYFHLTCSQLRRPMHFTC